MSAQDKDTSWRFAAGVTAYSQNSFVEGEHPIEINLRYRVKGNHVLKLKLPFMNRQKSHNMNYSLADILPPNVGNTVAYTPFDKEKLYGFDLGYDYNWGLLKGFSLTGGINLANYWYKNEIASVSTTISNVQPNNFTFSQSKSIKQAFGVAFKPQVGIRYIYRFLIGELSLGPNFRISDFRQKDCAESLFCKTPDDPLVFKNWGTSEVTSKFNFSVLFNLDISIGVVF